MTDYEYAVKINDLTVTYDAKPVLWDIDLEIPRGNLAAIIGPNGAGKTTLIKSMLGLLKPVSGTIKLHNPKEAGMSSSKIGYVPQSESVDWDFPASVFETALMGRYGRLGWFRRPTKKDKAITMDCLHKTGMQSFADKHIDQLSGGQQQRVFLARALAQEADIYFMDEPFKGVDAQTEKSIIRILKELKSEGKTVIIVHHDLQTVPDYFDWVTIINIHVIANGPVQDVFIEKNLKRAYRSSSSLLKGAV